MIWKADVTPNPSHATDPAGWWDLLHGQLAPDARVELPMLTGSMAPTLPVGATLIIVGLTDRDLSVGDIAVFPQKDRLVAHRLLAGAWLAGGGLFLQAGDTAGSAGWLRAGRVKGLVVGVIDALGTETDLRTVDARQAGRRQAQRRLTGLLFQPARRMLSWLR